jgi:ribosome-associated protein
MIMMVATCCCCLILTTITTATAFIQPSSRTSRIATTTTSQLHLSRKGNRGPSKPVSTNTQKRTRPQVNDVLNGISSPPTFPYSVDPTDIPPGSINDDPLTPLVHTIVHAADMRKASDIIAMRVTSCTSLTNFVIIVSGTSRPQNSAIANAITKDVSEYHEGKRCLGKGIPEGSADSGWILLDYGEIMVHVMTPKSRLFYDMEGQWKSRGGEYMDLSDVLIVEDKKNEDEIDDADYDYDDDELDEEEGDNNNIEADEDYEEYEDDEDYEDEEISDRLTMKERFDVEKEIDPFWS